MFSLLGEEMVHVTRGTHAQALGEANRCLRRCGPQALRQLDLATLG